MAQVTFQVLDGADRGRRFDDLVTPLTIGREEGNSIQLNDERVSRFHLKVQEDQDKIVLTDLESTNGTKVNGEETQLHILRYGDIVHVGRSVLLFGSEEQIAERLATLRAGQPENESGLIPADSDQLNNLDYELNWEGEPRLDATLHALRPPELPEDLSPAQAAQVAELLTYFHVRLRHLITTGKVDKDERVTLDQRQWQNLVDLQGRIAGYLRSVGEPPAE